MPPESGNTARRRGLAPGAHDAAIEPPGAAARRLFALLVIVACAAPVASAQQPLVTIEGGADKSGQNYAWTVTNRHTSPIVYVEFPHFNADTFAAPRGWTQKSTFLVNVGVPQKPGVCTATPDSPAQAIRPGRSAQFRMRIANLATLKGVGTARIRFADGTETTVAGVELPRAPSFGEKNIMLIGFAIILAVVVLVQVRHRRGKQAQANPGGSVAEGRG